MELNAVGFGSTDFVFQLDPPQLLTPRAVATNGVHVAVIWVESGTGEDGITIYRFPTN